MLDLSQSTRGQGKLSLRPASQPRPIFKCNLEFSSQLYLDDDQPESLPSRPCVSECQVTCKVIKSTRHVPCPFTYKASFNPSIIFMLENCVT